MLLLLGQSLKRGVGRIYSHRFRAHQSGEGHGWGGACRKLIHNQIRRSPKHKL